MSDGLKGEIAGLEQHIVPRNGEVSGGEQSSVKMHADNTILVIDDNPDIRSYLVNCLQAHYKVIEARDGEDGVRVARGTIPDLVICDIMMPGMNGYDVCRTIRADKRLNHIPLIFLTAKASSTMKIEGLETGADDYIAKPFNAKELVARVGNLITMRRQEKDLKTLNESLDEKVREQLETILKNKRLTRFFSKKLLNQIIASDREFTVTGERRNVTVFFSNLQNFTDFVDMAQAEEVARILNEYLTSMTELIERAGATLVQVIGDGIMVFFAAPDDMENQAQAVNAVRLAVLMQQEIRHMSRKWMSEGVEQEIKARMGIHQDYLTVGNFGSDEFMEYTAVGKGINLAS